MFDLIVRGGTVVTACGSYEADVGVRAGRIAAIAAGLEGSAARVVDAAGCLVLPGAIDPHTHIEMPLADGAYNADDWWTGTVAAAAGGTTTVLDMITPERGGSLLAALANWQQRAAARAAVDYSFHVGVIEHRPDQLAEMERVVAAGVPSFKVYFAYKGRVQIDDAAAFAVFRRAAELGAEVCAHCENGDVIAALVEAALAAGRTEPSQHAATRPPLAEGEATARAAALAAIAGSSLYVVHVSCREALEAVRRARAAGQRLTAETCMHYLLCDESAYHLPGFESAKYVLSPPLRAREHLEALWAGVADGAISVIGSDHCPFFYHGQKDCGARAAGRPLPDFSRIPNGGPGIEDRVSLLYTYGVRAGRITLERWIELVSTGPARCFGLLPRKGHIAVGADADIAVFDPRPERRLSASDQRQRVDYNLFEGMTVRGRFDHVLVRGQPIIESGQVVARPGQGRFIGRAPQPSHAG